MNIGDRVRASCDRHDTCKKLRGVIVDIRKNNFYTHQVQWDQKEKPDWYSVRGLERIKS